MNHPTPPENPAAPARALLKALEEQFPVIREARPLAIGIDAAIASALPDIDRKSLRAALRMHTGSTRYLKQMTREQARYDLGGAQAGEITEEQRNHASEKLKERFKKQAEERKAKQAEEEAERRRAEKLSQLAAKFSRR